MKKILIIEDNTELQTLYKDGLAQKGYTEVEFAKTAPAGLSLITSSKPDLVILDIMLPDGSNGFDLLEQMKKDPKMSSIPVFMITNLDSQEKIARDIGVADYIVKSLTPFDTIIEKIATYLA